MKREKRYKQFFVEGSTIDIFCIGSNASIEALDSYISNTSDAPNVEVNELLLLMISRKIFGIFECKDEKDRELCDKSNEELKKEDLLLENAEWAMAAFYADPEKMKDVLKIPEEDFKDFLSIPDPFDKRFEELGVYENDKKIEADRKTFDGLLKCKTNDEIRECMKTLTDEQINKFMGSMLLQVFRDEEDPVGFLKEHGVLPKDWDKDYTNE